MTIIDAETFAALRDTTGSEFARELIDTFLTDMRAKGRTVAAPSDPFHDDDFIHALMETYNIAPTTDWIDRVA